MSAARWLAGLTALAVLGGTATVRAADLETQDVLLDVSDPATTRIELRLVFVAQGATHDVPALNFALPIVRAEVKGVEVTPVPDAQYPQYVTRIPLPTPINGGESFDVTLTLEGTPSCGGSQARCFRDGDLTVFPPAAPGSAVYYTDPFATDAFEGRIDVVLPAGHLARAGSGGEPTVTEVSPTTEMWSFPFAPPMQAFGIWVGNGAKFDTASREGAFDVVGTFAKDVDDPDAVRQAVDLSAQLLPVLSEQYGALPIARADLVAVPSSFAFGALSTLGIVYVNSLVFTSHTYLVDQGMAHELSHFWWGNLASGLPASETPLLAEGMAEYAGFRALGVLRGAATRTAGMRMNASWYMYRRPGNADDEIVGVDVESPVFVHVTYHKGALFFRALEEYVGEDAFGRALRRFFARGQDSLSLARLGEDVTTESGVDVSGQIAQWTKQKGYPTLVATSRPTESGVEVEVSLEESYHLAVPVRITSSDGTTSWHTLTIDPGTTRQTIATPGPIASVEIDPAWTFVREVHPAIEGDVTLDGRVDGADLIEVALHHDAYLPSTRRVDGSYDALVDVARDEIVDDGDLARVVELALATGP